MRTTIDRAQDVLQFLANTDDGVFVVGADHRIVLWNQAAEWLLGYTAEDVLGKPCHEVMGGRDTGGHAVCRTGCGDLTLGQDRRLVPTRDLLVATKDGREIWINVTNLPIPWEFAGEFVLAHIFRDATAAKDLEEFKQRVASVLEEFPAYRLNHHKVPHMSPLVAEMLTPREREVLVLLAGGADAKDVAQGLSISLFTARKHIHNILTKLNVHTALQAVASAFD